MQREQVIFKNVYVSMYTYMQVTTSSEQKRGHDLEREQEKVWREEQEKGNYGILISKIKNLKKNLCVLLYVAAMAKTLSPVPPVL